MNPLRKRPGLFRVGRVAYPCDRIQTKGAAVIRKLILIPALAALSTLAFAAEANLSASSPDGRIQIAFLLNDGAPAYRVDCDGREVIRTSPLGFVLEDLKPAIASFIEKRRWQMTHGFEMVDAARKTVDETWKPVWGTASDIRNHGNELTVRLRQTNEPYHEMNIVFRAFDDGVAFRYVLPAQSNLQQIAVVSEETKFRFSGNHTAWWHPVDYNGDEKKYNTTPLSDIQAFNTPVTMKTGDGLYLSLHEAALLDYASMTLGPVAGEPFTLRCDLVPWPDGLKVKTSVPLTTPWRTIQIADRAGGLVESHLIENLNEPCKITDTSWIEPMKYMGIWWGMHIGTETWNAGPTHGATTDNARRYIDFAAANGIRGLLIEGWNKGWETWFHGDGFSFTEPYPDFDLEAVAAYAQEKGVALIGHQETGGNIPAYEAEMEAAFAQYERLGVHAVKTGYAGEIIPKGQHHHGQWMINHYQSVVEKAAAHRIALDVHEPIKFTGLSRTWPNLMTGEGVRGTEYEAWSDGNPPEHTTIIPFTRGLGGPMDYTPGIFATTFPSRPDNRVHTTVAKQLALYVVLFSPLQMAADLPENYEGRPEFRFIRAVPATWDETRVLDAEIGDFVVIARRKGDAWYLGAITDENARELQVPLSFLEPGRKYEAKIYADGKDADFETNPAPVEISTRTLQSSNVLGMRLARSGGQAVSLKPLPAGR